VSDRLRNVLAVGLVVAALAVAVAFWPPSPVELGEEWLVETTCVPAEDGVRFTASVHAPATARVAATEASYPVAAANSGEASVQLVSAATPNPPLALVDVALSAGAVKSPTCAATVIGHR